MYEMERKHLNSTPKFDQEVILIDVVGLLPHVHVKSNFFDIWPSREFDVTAKCMKSALTFTGITFLPYVPFKVISNLLIVCRAGFDSDVVQGCRCLQHFQEIKDQNQN